MDATRYAFQLSSFNELRGVADHYQLFVHVKPDGSEEIEIWANKPNGEGKRKFLAPTKCPTVALKDIKAGGKLSIFSRQYDVIGFDDEVTTKALSKSHNRFVQQQQRSIQRVRCKQYGCLVRIINGCQLSISIMDVYVRRKYVVRCASPLQRTSCDHGIRFAARCPRTGLAGH